MGGAEPGVTEVGVSRGRRVKHLRRGTRTGQRRGHEIAHALVDASEDAGYWTLQTAIFPENLASISLHERCGFRRVGTRERIGSQNGRWRDTVLMERRSALIGG